MFFYPLGKIEDEENIKMKVCLLGKKHFLLPFFSKLSSSYLKHLLSWNITLKLPVNTSSI